MSDVPPDPDLNQRNPWNPESRSYQIVLSTLKQLPDQGKMATFFEQFALAHVLVRHIDMPTHRRYIIIYSESSTYPNREKDPRGAETWTWMYLIDVRTGEGILQPLQANGALLAFAQMGIRLFRCQQNQAWKGYLEDGMLLIRRTKHFKVVLRSPGNTHTNRVHLEPVKQKKTRGWWKGMR